MKLSVQSGAKIAAAVAALMLAGSVAAPSAANAGVCPIAGHDANACKGKASCKGKGSCKGHAKHRNSCKSHSSCKGKNGCKGNGACKSHHSKCKS